MTSETPPEVAPGTAKLRRPHPPQAAAQEQMMNAIDAVDAEASNSQGSAEDQASSTTSDSVDLDWDGTVRTMSKAEIVALAKQAEEATKATSLAQEVLKRAGAVEHIAQAYAAMDDAQKAAFGKVLKDPKLLRRIDAASQEISMFEEPQQVDARDEKLDKLQALVMRQNEVLINLGRERAQTALNDQVSAAMDQFRVFRDNPELGEMARENILMGKALNPEADLTKLVAAAAGKAAAHQQRQIKGQVENLGRVLTPGTPPAVPKFRGSDLGKGKMAEYVRQQIDFAESGGS